MYGSKLKIRRFDKQIEAYEAKPVEKGRIILYGHSTFTRCKPDNRWGHPNVEETVLNKDGTPAILNHGFGTSSADDLLYYYHRMVTPYEPKALALAAGGNDFSFGYTPEEVCQITARVIQYAKADFPEIPVYVFVDTVTLRHKYATAQYAARRERYSKCVHEMCEQFEKCTPVSMVHQPFFFSDPADIGHYDRIREDLHCNDQVHFNSYGYTLYHDFLRELFDPLL